MEEEKRRQEEKREKRPRSRGDGNGEVVRFGLWPTLTVTGVWDHLACVCASVCVCTCPARSLGSCHLHQWRIAGRKCSHSAKTESEREIGC